MNGKNIRNNSESNHFYFTSEEQPKKNISGFNHFNGHQVTLAPTKGSNRSENKQLPSKKIYDHKITYHEKENTITAGNNNKEMQESGKVLNSTSEVSLDCEYVTTSNNKKLIPVVFKPNKDHGANEIPDDSLEQTTSHASTRSISQRDMKDEVEQSQIDKKINKLLKSCKKGRSYVIYYASAGKNALLIWDPVNKKTVYTTFNNIGKQIFSEAELGALRKDMLEYSGTHHKTNIVKLKGLDAQGILKKVREKNTQPKGHSYNNSAEYIAELLKVSFPNESFINSNHQQTSIDTNNLALEIRKKTRSKRKEQRESKRKLRDQTKSNEPLENTIVNKKEVVTRKIVLPNGEVLIIPVRTSSSKNNEPDKRLNMLNDHNSILNQKKNEVKEVIVPTGEKKI